MTRKDGHPAEESFTLQFGESKAPEDTDEVLASADAIVDDHFMWNSTAAILEESLKDEADAPIVPDEIIADGASKPSEDIQAAAASFADGNPIEVSDQSLDGTIAKDTAERVLADVTEDTIVARGAEDVPEPLYGDDLDGVALEDDDSIVLDERQVAMVSAPEITVEPIHETSFPELRADPTAAITPKDVPSFARSAIEDDVSLDDTIDEPPVMLPIVRPVAQRQKAPWVIYGTLGLGVCVLSIATVGMVLQLREPQDPGVFVAQAEIDQAGSTLSGVGTGASPQAPTQLSDVDVQSKVFRLAAGPLVDDESRIARVQVDEGIDLRAPSGLEQTQPDQDILPSLGTSQPVSVGAEPGVNFGASQDADVLALADRIAVDLGEETGLGGDGIELDVSSTSTSLSADPEITVAPTPELTTVVETVDAPVDEFAARTLFAAVDAISNDMANLTFAANGPTDVEQATTVSAVWTLDAPLGRSEAPVFASFDIAQLTSADLQVQPQAGAPLAAVRLASGDVRVAPEDRVSNGVLDVKALVSRQSLAEPVRIAGVGIPEPNLPRPSIDASGALLLAAKAAEAEAARLRAEELELARRAQEVQDSIRVATVAVETATAPLADVQTQAPAEEEIASIQAPDVTPDVVVPVQVEPAKPNASARWVAKSGWVPALGFSYRQAIEDGRGVLEVVGLDEAAPSTLPDWAGQGSSIVTVNGVDVESDAAFMEALLGEDRGADSGVIGATMMIRARAGLDPRSAKIEVPVTRHIQLGDGTELATRLDGRKWVAEVVGVVGNDPSGLQIGDVLLRDFMTKSNLRAPEALEDLFAAMTEAGETRVEFAVMRDGELASGGVSLSE